MAYEYTADELLEKLTQQEKLILTNDQIREQMVKAQKDAIYGFYKSLFSRQYVLDFMSEGKTPYENLETDDQKQIIDKARNAVVSKPPYAFITVNPYKEITLDELRKYVNKFLRRKIIDSYYLVYEVRKEDLSGLHCHMLVKYNCKPYDLKRNVKSTFKNVCDETNPCILNVKYIEYDILQSKINYMNGEKKDAKQEGVKATKVYRFQNGLPDFQESTPPLPCRGAEYLSFEDEHD